MTGLGHAPYALFVLDNFPVAKLTAASEELGIAYLWLVPKADFSDAPRVRDDNKYNEGTKSPVADAFTSPFIGESIHAVALLLKAAPLKVDLDGTFFSVQRKEDEPLKSITICRRDERDKVQYYHILAGSAAMELDTMEPGKREERYEFFVDRKKDKGEPME